MPPHQRRLRQNFCVDWNPALVAPSPQWSIRTKKERITRKRDLRELKILADVLHLSHLLQCHHRRPTLSIGSKPSKQFTATEASWTGRSTLIYWHKFYLAPRAFFFEMVVWLHHWFLPALTEGPHARHSPRCQGIRQQGDRHINRIVRMQGENNQKG